MSEMTDEERQAMIDLANEARRRAYAPYSHYQVGAALRTASGRIYTGVNIENASFGLTVCAERTAIFKAVSDGETRFEVLAVTTINGVSPCGACRQVLAEFGLNTVVLIGDSAGRLVKETKVADLLPGAFRPEDLKTK